MKCINSSILSLVLVACAHSGPAGNAAPSDASSQTAQKPVAIARYAGLAGPASVLYDAELDRYLVSNVNGNTLGQDNNGFISVLSPDGHVTELKWIEGGKNNVRLDAPKGLTIANGVLYVADITVVRTFDAKTGAPRADIPVPGATFLNDLVTTPNGQIYLSDPGMPNGKVDATGTDAIYRLEANRAVPIARGKSLNRPDSLAWTEQGLVVGPFGADELYRIDEKGVKRDVTKLPAGGLAGIVPLGDSLLVTSYQTSAVYRGKLGGAFEVVLAEQKAPADIGYDNKRERLLLPHFTEDTVEAFALR